MNLDLSKTVYGVAAITPSGQHINLSSFVRTLMYEEQQNELAMRVQMDVDNRKVNGTWLHSQVPIGSWVYVYSHTTRGVEEVFRGRVLVFEPHEDPTIQFSLTAYDPLIHLQNSKDDRFYQDGTSAKTILLDIFQAWGIPVGTVQVPDIKLSKQVFRAQTVADMVNTVLDQVKKRGGGKFYVRYSQGKVSVLKPGQNTPVYRLHSYGTVSRVSDQWTAEQLVTRVKIIGHEDKEGRAPVVATVDGRTDFGVFQDVILQSSYNTPAAAKQAAQDIINEKGQPQKIRQIVAVDIPFLRRGDKVHIQSGTLDGDYIVSWIQHDATTRTMTLGVEDS
jgi:hypothetical protein